ncbi:MAG TPA: hypothetical protein VFQ43_10865 [Nitrososphaera sp.]|nr:hypothetical protein [Nitrososphaera sp.]
MAPSSDYRKAYDSAKQELADLLAKQQEVAKRIVVVRQSLQTLATLCESEGVEINRSIEADYLLRHSTLADEIRTILNSVHPGYLRPHQIKTALERLGLDLTQYQNPQATIHMVLKRMTESGEVQEAIVPKEGKKTYRLAKPKSRMAIAFAKAKMKSFGGIE